MEQIIPFNKPHITGKEVHYIYDAVASGHISGNGKYTKLCQSFFEERFGFKRALLTTSCTDALEMCALLLDIKAGDEVIIPSYTFVSTALAFVRQGAKIVFADSRSDHPGMDEERIEELITAKTKVIVPVHYAGVSCDMAKIMTLANKYNLFVVEDAAQGIDSYYINTDGTKAALGSIGHLAAFSFHETKNIQSGEGGLLAINDERFIKRAEIIWEKGTNRAEFFRGEVNKYGWVDTGSSFLPSEVTAAFLWAQLEELDLIQEKRILLWNTYFSAFTNSDLREVRLPSIPHYATVNGHMFYLVCNNEEVRSGLISKLKRDTIHSVFHYLSLHSSPYYKDKYIGKELVNSDKYSQAIVRLPLFFDLSVMDVELVLKKVKEFVK
ncbi:dTDP-4-amino-4,6-dideoxygalactose transaminase [Geofilum rubicundum]|uniref:4-keto-6-deoxy-N-Acetyl-D-hexosaminyl-aminotransferase n=1 Tax=Geofilum rubicundum JCM 15548 TaxID=1236989 RepID=A0A0E9M0F6_9BACT|nr:dTDP-4-amino-4,6-dideoxygalactose transaminase [Geofilum rubicundum]GAO30615.1 4-keto-6-deoxy-N-Acetyl-D-hexosaminyl-aminotransferase [Geofilum rubicundum JCM 15548]